MHLAITNAIRLTMEETVIAMVCRLQRLDHHRHEHQAAIEKIRRRLFPNSTYPESD